MKIIYNKILPFPGYAAINLFGVLFARSEYKGRINEFTINHETIHTKQMAEMLWIPFYLWYGVEWFIKLFKYGSGKEAYRNISFEREAYENEMDLAYKYHRKPWAWFKKL